MTLMASEVRSYLPYGREITRADLRALPDDGHRYELIDGALLVTPAPRFQHQLAVANLYTALREAAPAELTVLFAPFDVALAANTVIQPDILVARRDAFTDTELPGPPLLAIEVLSPSTRSIDLLLKKERLQRAGCPHYWVIDPDEPSITAWDLTDGVYRDAAHALGEGLFEVTTPFPVRLAPAALLA